MRHVCPNTEQSYIAFSHVYCILYRKDYGMEGSYAKLARSSTRVAVLIIPPIPIPIPIALINVAAAKLTLL